MPTVFFVDTDPGTAEQWQQSGHNSVYTACPFTPFSEVAETAKRVKELKPDFVVIAPLLGATRGMYVFHNLRVDHKFGGRLMINGPLGSKTDVRCTPDELREMLDDSVELAALPTSPPPSRHGILTPGLKQSTIGKNGYVKCPHTHLGEPCSGLRYVKDEPGEYTCFTCHKRFLAVATPPATNPDETLTAQAFNEYGDIRCPRCDRVVMDAVRDNSPVQVACENDRCGITFTGKPFTVSATT